MTPADFGLSLCSQRAILEIPLQRTRKPFPWPLFPALVTALVGVFRPSHTIKNTPQKRAAKFGAKRTPCRATWAELGRHCAPRGPNFRAARAGGSHDDCR